jgi:UMF1 family MFS transporter
VNAPSPSAGGDRRVVLSWSLYDLANTIYYAIVVTYGMPEYVRQRYGAQEWVGYVTAGTLLAAGFVSPSLGSHVDRTGRAVPGLTFWTIVCVATAGTLSVTAALGLPLVLGTYAVSLFAYQAALTYYNALLPVVASERKAGAVSGLGTGLGYVMLPLAYWAAIEIEKRWGIPPSFLLAAVAMTAWSIPLWLFVRDRPRALQQHGTRRGVLDALRYAAGDRTLVVFLLANFLCADVANTLIQWANVYFRDSEGLSPDIAAKLLVALSFTAFVAGIGVGRVADRMSPTLLYGLCCAGLAVGLVGAAVFPRTVGARAVLIVTGGVGVAAIWTIGRQLVVRLVPPARHGEFFGLYGVTVKVSVIGTALFGALSKDGVYTDAVLVEAGMLLLGVALIGWLHVRVRREGRA